MRLFLRMSTVYQRVVFVVELVVFVVELVVFIVEQVYIQLIKHFLMSQARVNSHILYLQKIHAKLLKLIKFLAKKII